MEKTDLNQFSDFELIADRYAEQRFAVSESRNCLLCRYALYLSMHKPTFSEVATCMRFPMHGSRAIVNKRIVCGEFKSVLEE